MSSVSRRFQREGTPLTPRELEVLTLAAEGLSGAQIAGALVISTHTVRTHMKNIREKLDAATAAGAVAIVMRSGLIRPRV